MTALAEHGEVRVQRAPLLFVVWGACASEGQKRLAYEETAYRLTFQVERVTLQLLPGHIQAHKVALHQVSLPSQNDTVLSAIREAAQLAHLESHCGQVGKELCSWAWACKSACLMLGIPSAALALPCP